MNEKNGDKTYKESFDHIMNEKLYLEMLLSNLNTFNDIAHLSNQDSTINKKRKKSSL